MNREELLRLAAARAGCGAGEARRVYEALVAELAGAMARGETVDCLPELGRFIPKLRENPGRNAGSPRSRRNPHYFIHFKVGKEFEEALLAASQPPDGGA